MITLPADLLAAYRSRTFRTAPGLRLASLAEAVQFVNERGFVFFWPIKGWVFPSLWTAAAGDRPVADAHDDPGHVTWGWKDSQLGTKVWYYGRVLKGKNAMISLDCLPYFYALSPNYGEPETDYLLEYEEGRLPLETRQVFEALLREGPLDTLSLRKKAHLNSAGSESAFNRALEQLQRAFRILPVGISEAGGWRYSFIYDLTHRHFPDLIAAAGQITENQAREELAGLFFRSLGAAPINALIRILRWDSALAERAVNQLTRQGILSDCRLEGENGRCLAHTALVGFAK